MTLLAFYRKNHQASDAELENARAALSRVVSEVMEPVPISSEQSRWRFVWNHSRSLVTGKAYTYFEYESSHFGEQLRRTIRDDEPHLVHVDSMDLYRWLGRLDGIPTTCTHHSIESELLALRARRLRNPLSRAYLLWQADRLRLVEENNAPRVSVNLMMSPLDAKRLESIAPDVRTAVVPNGVDIQSFQSALTEPSSARDVVFLGPLYMYPNWDGILFFIREAWPAVRRAVPDATLTLVGKASPAQTEQLEAVDGVRVLGFVPDVRPHLAAARCCIAPLRIGGGTRLKILEYWAMGKPVVTTSIGCEGLATSDGANVLIRDEAGSFAGGVVEVLTDDDLSASLGRAARTTVETTYSWERIGEELRSLYNELIGREASP